jgi:hypothetical protein
MRELFYYKIMRADLRVIGPQASFKRYLAASQTAIVAGEPLHSVATLSSGAANANVYVLAAADTPVIGTHKFGGIALKDSENAAAGTTLAQFLTTANPVPGVGRIVGKAETAANVDTLAELVAILQDATLIDYSATGATDGGQLYTIKDTASADTSGLEIVGGNIAIGTLEVTLAATAYRHDVA